MRRLAAVGLAVALAAGCGSSGSKPGASPSSRPGVTGAAAAGPKPRLVVLVEENHSADQVIGRPGLPNINAMAEQGTLLTRFFAITHPSLPNYLALTSGDTHGITSDCGHCEVDADNLGAQLERAGVTWKVYAQGLPASCDRSPTAGDYAKKHVPFLYYRSILDDPRACADVVPYERFAADARAGELPMVSFVIPDVANDMHGVGDGQDPREVESRADEFAGQLHRTLRSSPAWEQDTRLVITWDEGGGGESGDSSCCDGLATGGHIPTLVVGPRVAAGTDATTYTTYSLLRSIEQLHGLPLLGHAADDRTRPIPAITG